MRTSIVELQTRRMRRSAQLWGGGCCGGWTEAVPRGAGQCKDLVVHTALCCKYKYDSNWERAVKRKFEFGNIQFWGAEREHSCQLISSACLNSTFVFRFGSKISFPTQLNSSRFILFKQPVMFNTGIVLTRMILFEVLGNGD
jgi:hypothetical protein